MLHLLQSLSQSVSSIIVFWILYLLYKALIRPYILLQHYKKQGGVIMFHWQIIPYLKNFKNTFKYGHFYHDYIEAVQNNPKARFIAENFGSKVNVILVDPVMIKDCLMRHEVYEKDWEGFELLKDLVGASGGSSKGSKWKRSRRIVSTVFSFDNMKTFVPIMIETAQENFKKWIDQDKLSNFHLVENMAGITGGVTGKSIFGTKFAEFKIEGEDMGKAVQKAVDSIFQEFFSPSILSVIFGSKFYRTSILSRHKKLNKTIANVRSQARSLIAEIEKSGKREKNLLWTLLDDRGTDVDSLNDLEILGEFIGLFVAGTETTSHLISSAIYFLWKHPETYKKLKEEVDLVFADLDSLDLETINRMDYMNCIIKETFRLGGPVGLLQPRTLYKDDDLCGVTIKKGTWINYYHNIYYMSEQYFTNAKEFIPERWLPGSQEGYRGEPFCYLPFAAGPRNCLGQHLAQITAKVTIGLFIRTFNFKFPEDFEVIMVQKGVYESFEPLVAKLTVIQ